MDDLDADFLRLEAFNRDALRLARLACLAVRVEPHLLRALRRALLPMADLSAELDLWQSPLVRLRNSTAMVFEPEALNRLRDALATDPQRHAALEVTRACFEAHPPLARLDIELNALPVIEPEIGDARIDAAFAPLLATLRAGGEPALRAASWLLQSVPRWHPRLLASNAGWAARLGASALLGGRQLTAGLPPKSVAGAQLAAAMPSDAIERRRLGVTMTRQRLAFTLPEDARGAVLEVPVLSPSLLVLEIDGEPARVIEAEEGRAIELSGVAALTLRSLVGDGWRVEPGRPGRPNAGATGARPEASGWQLLVHDDPDLLDVVEDMVHRALAGATPVTARSIEMARRQVADRGLAGCSIVVIGSMSTLGTRTTAVPSTEPMREFVHWLKSRRPELPVIVLAAVAEARLADFLRAFDRTALVGMSVDFEQQLADRLAEFHGAERSGPETRVDFHLRLGTRSSWSLSVSGKLRFEATGELVLDPEALERVLFQSTQWREMLWRDPAPPGQGWQRALKYLSDDMRRLFFDGALPNVAAWEAFVKYRKLAGGIENTRIWVTGDARIRELLLEALNDRVDGESGFWALRAPLIRCPEDRLSLRPLFMDAEQRDISINCLVIEADGDAGHVPEYSTSFPTITFAAIAMGIADVFDNAGVYRLHLRLSEHAGDPQRMLADALRQRPWHLVHFCGHAVGTSFLDAGLVLAARPGGVISAGALGELLRPTQFLFLDTGHSPSSATVTQAFERLVPALLSYQRPVDLQRQTVFAWKFYDALLDRDGVGYKRLEYAVMLARRQVHDASPDDPDWLAPVLTMQRD